jgi:trimethylamine--corrinoid protein Co-methyltransferase
VACLPAHVVEDAVRSAPAEVVLCGRDPANDVVLEDGRVGFTNFGEGIQVVDPYTGELHESRKQDVADCTRIIDALPEIDVVERPLGAHDVPPDTAALHNAEAIFSNTTKHATIGPLSGFCAVKMIDMAAAIAGGREKLRKRPILSFLTCPVSPLKLVADACRIIIEGARAGVPVNVLSMAMAGGSSPLSLAGTLVTHNAEVLAGITLAQLTARGAPVIYGSSTTALDLRFASASVGSPECGMIGAGVACLARFYLLPSWVAGA